MLWDLILYQQSGRLKTLEKANMQNLGKQESGHTVQLDSPIKKNKLLLFKVSATIGQSTKIKN